MHIKVGHLHLKTINFLYKVIKTEEKKIINRIISQLQNNSLLEFPFLFFYSLSRSPSLAPKPKLLKDTKKKDINHNSCQLYLG